MNLRSGRLKTEMTDEAAEYTSSLEFDKIIFEADINQFCTYFDVKRRKYY